MAKRKTHKFDVLPGLRLYTTTEVAHLLHWKPVTVRRMAQRNEIKSYKINKQWRFSEEHIKNYTESLP